MARASEFFNYLKMHINLRGVQIRVSQPLLELKG
jgi:hypothetical protein